MGSIGDVVRGLALVDQIKDSWPETELSWLVEPRCEEIVRAHPRIDRVIVFNRKKGLAAIPKLRRELKSPKFDLVLDLQRHFKSGFFSYLTNSPRRIGFGKSDSKEMNWLFQTETIPALGENLPKLKHYLAFIEKLGLEIKQPLSFGLNEYAQKHDRNLLLGNDIGKYIVFILGSTWQSKDWSLEGYFKLAQAILDKFKLKIVLAGDKTQIAIGTELSEGLKSERVFNKVAKTTLGEVSSIIKGAVCVVGPDSGPGHISGALGVPYISLFGPTDPIRTAPYLSEKLVIKSDLACMPCYRRRCPGLDKLCMRLIRVEEVVAKISALAETI